MAKVPRIREKYEEKSGKSALTKAGAKTKEYQDFLINECTPVWSAVWSKAYKRNSENPYKSGADLIKDLDEFTQQAKLNESCVAGGRGGTGANFKAIGSFRTESKEKFNLKNY
jgi:hypothetical protein